MLLSKQSGEVAYFLTTQFPRAFSLGSSRAILWQRKKSGFLLLCVAAQRSPGGREPRESKERVALDLQAARVLIRSEACTQPEFIQHARIGKIPKKLSDFLLRRGKMSLSASRDVGLQKVLQSICLGDDKLIAYWETRIIKR